MLLRFRRTLDQQTNPRRICLCTTQGQRGTDTVPLIPRVPQLNSKGEAVRRSIPRPRAYEDPGELMSSSPRSYTRVIIGS